MFPPSQRIILQLQVLPTTQVSSKKEVIAKPSLPEVIELLSKSEQLKSPSEVIDILSDSEDCDAPTAKVSPKEVIA